MEESIVQFLYKSGSSKDFVVFILEVGWCGLCVLWRIQIYQYPFFYPACLSLLIWYIVVILRKILVFCFLSSLIFLSLSLKRFSIILARLKYSIVLQIYYLKLRTCYYTLRFELSNRKICYQNLFYSYWSR